jgi:hypothetical protein
MIKNKNSIRKLQSIYYLQKVTNDVIKWTGIVSDIMPEKTIDKSYS